jgi:hypothetical protein
MNSSLGLIQLLFYYPPLFFFLYLYLVVFIPKINALNINNIFSQLISKLKKNNENKL